MALDRPLESRPASPEELEVLRFLLSFEFEGVGSLRRDLDDLWVQSSCSCGCGSIELIPAARSTPPAEHRPAPLDISVRAEGASPAGGMILFTSEGHLAELEVYSVGDGALSGVPRLALIDVDVEDD